MEIEYDGTAHVKALDGLRGIAITLVLLLHFFGFTPLSWFTALGWTGVDLFFVLSGFLITGILIDSKNSESNYRNFIVKRILRIFPLYYLVLCIFLIASLADLDQFAPYSPAPYWLHASNLAMAFNGWQTLGIAGHLGHFWSLSIEEQFYFIWPIFVFQFSAKYILRFSLFLVLFSLVLRNLVLDYPFVYVFTLTRLDGLAVGASIAVMVRYDVQVLQRIVPKLIVLVVLGLLVILILNRGTFSNANPLVIRAGYSLIAIFYGCVLVFTLARENLLRRLCESRILIFMGKYSYGMYVYHWILYSILILRMELFGNITEASTTSKLLAGVLLTIITILISYISYNFFEVYFLRLRGRFSAAKNIAV